MMFTFILPKFIGVVEETNIEIYFKGNFGNCYTLLCADRFSYDCEQVLLKTDDILVYLYKYIIILGKGFRIF